MSRVSPPERILSSLDTKLGDLTVKTPPLKVEGLTDFKISGGKSPQTFKRESPKALLT